MTSSLNIEPHPRPLVNIVLFEPEIPGNTGAIGRTAVAIGAKLWLVRPLGFNVDEKTLRRAGLDYWQHLDWQVVKHWDDLLEQVQPDPERMWLLSKFGQTSYTDVAFQRGDTLVFGRETSGLPDWLTESHAANLLRIPTTDKVRSLNLATSAGIVSYEVLRQVTHG